MHENFEGWRKHEEAKLIRLSEVLKLIPVSRSTWWEGVRTGLYPEPVKLGPKITCWHLSKINKLISEGINKKQPNEGASVSNRASYDPVSQGSVVGEYG